VLDTFGELGLAWRETDDADTDRSALVRDLLERVVFYRNRD